MAVNKVVYGNKTLIDLSGDTLVSADQLLKDIVAHCKDGSTITGTMEAGGGGVTGITTGIYIPASTGYDHVITHGLGVIPKLFAICAGDYVSSGSYVLDSAHGFSDRNLLFRMSRISAANSPSGYINNSSNITQNSFSKNTALAKANETTINVGGNYQLTAGIEYYWFALA